MGFHRWKLEYFMVHELWHIWVNWFLMVLLLLPLNHLLACCNLIVLQLKTSVPLFCLYLHLTIVCWKLSFLCCCLNSLGGCFLSYFQFIANQSRGAAGEWFEDSKLSSWLSCFWKMCDQAVNRTISWAFLPRLYLVYSCEWYLGNSCVWPCF